MTWDEYLEKMGPWIRRLVRPRIRPHPYLGHDDLMQEGLTALWETWQTFHGDKPDDDLCRLGTTIMRRRMADASEKSQQRGEGRVQMTPLDRDVKIRGAGSSKVRSEDDWADDRHHVKRDISSPRDGVDTALLGRGMADLDAKLTGVAQRVLREVLAPGTRTVEIVRALWGTSNPRPWAAIRTRALAAGLGCSVEEVRDAWRVVEACVRKLLAGEAATLAPVRYTPIEALTPNPTEAAMDNAASTAVNPVDDLMPPGMEALKEEIENVKKKKAEKPAKGKAEKAKAKPKTKTAAPKGPKPPKAVFDEKRTLPIGTKIKCKRGSGEVTDIFYRVKLKDGAMCNVSAKAATAA